MNQEDDIYHNWVNRRGFGLEELRDIVLQCLYSTHKNVGYK